ncbi:MAG TPA: GNAT family N-acetyltransferase [Gaiellaceae bacterium]|nr:GNAT family N-acetyltransferase [Gaiellaceae bacterium]
MEIVPFTDAHLDAAAEMLAARHARHREAEPLLPADVDFRAQVEQEWSVDGASGFISPHCYLFGRPDAHGWFTVGIGGHAVDGDAEHARDLYAAAAGAWVEAGHSKHMAFVPASDRELIDAWFRLSFGASAVLAMRETAPEEPFEAGVTIRPGTPDDFGAAARLELALLESMQPSPSFSGMTLRTPNETEAEWRADDFSSFELFVAERDSAIVGHVLLYRRPADLRVPRDAIDLGQVSVFPEARGTGVGRALTAHAIRWAHDHGHPTMTTDWRMTNLWASRFWPKRGFRTTFLRLYRSIP